MRVEVIYMVRGGCLFNYPRYLFALFVITLFGYYIPSFPFLKSEGMLLQCRNNLKREKTNILGNINALN